LGYKNGRDVLPEELLKEIQKYVQGELIYVPKKESSRAGWGENNGTRKLIRMRNQEIYRLYLKGLRIRDLVDRYHLSEDSIRKIISNTRQK